MANEAIFRWKPLSLKQKIVFNWWRSAKYRDKDGIICDGSVRAGKTAPMSLSFIDWATESYEEENFALCGKTIGSLRRNVLNPLKKMMRGRGYVFKEYRSQGYVKIYNPRSKTTNYFYLFGGKDESSQDLIQGITLAGILFDEVALMPESFVNQGTARCSVEGSKYWFNCNPDNPFHWFKVNWLEKVKEKNMIHLHFTMKDNLSLSDKVRERYERMYSGVFYKRFILGLWVIAEGVIFDMFNEEKHIKQAPFTMKDATRLFVCVDYGTQNPMTYGLMGAREYYINGNKVTKYHLFKSYYYSGRDTGKQKTDGQYADDMEEFIKDIKEVSHIIVDPSASSFIAELKKRGLKVIRARNSVKAGIRFMMERLNLEEFSMDISCIEDKKEFYTYIWNAKALERGVEEPTKDNDHCMDKIRYGMFTDYILSGGKAKNYSGIGAMVS